MLKPLLLLLLTAIISFGSSAQTQPVPQVLPYAQNFDGLAHSATVYPAGWQGWSLAGSPSGSFNTAAPAGDKALAANGSASSTTNGAYNYNGKLGFLNSGSADNGLVLALNASGQLNISLQYQISTLRNPYDGNSNTRINEVTLQYRIGSTGDFTNIDGTTYQNNTVTQTGSGVTTPQNPAAVNITLPADCNNQPLLQLRWVNRQIGGAGSRPSFAVDDIQVAAGGGDTTAPAISALLPANGDSAASPASRPLITFSENVKAGAGNLILHNASTHTGQIFSVDSPAVVIAGNTLTLHTLLQPLTAYYITLDAGAVADLSGNAFAGITDSTAWRFTTGLQQLSFDFTDCTPSGSSTLSGGFIQYSVSGAQLWGCTTFGQDNSNAVQINGFSNGAQQNEDWLISPAFDLSGFNYPLLRFATRTRFAGPALQLKVSTDYDGSSDPHTATWTLLNGRFPEADSDTWQLSDSINLARFKQGKVYIAFVYTSSPALQAARWTVDDISLYNSTAAPAPGISSSPAALDFDYVKAGQESASQSFSFWGSDISGSLTLTAPAAFVLAKDSSGPYSQTLTYSQQEAEEGPHTAWVKFVPNAADQQYSGAIAFSGAGLQTGRVALSGTSLRSLKVVNWNIEWFGSPAQDPANDSLQQANVTAILRNVDADVFALAEVVDTLRFKNVVSQLPGYSYVISDFGSYADNVADPDYPGAQKLAFVYKTDVIRPLRTYGVLRQNGSDSAYFNWSSGRFPYLMEAMAHLNGDSARVQFVLLHAKANTGSAAEKREAWDRRRNGARELKDSLDAHHPYSNIIMLGDFNDALDKTITAERAPDTTTSYIDFMTDTADYKPLTLPLSLAKQRSTISFSTVIDNVVSSNEVGTAYVPGSARILTQVERLVAGYGNTTTDHYPVLSRYNLRILANPAPIQAFTARVDSARPKLSWNTPYEINTASFVVERSYDQRTFSAFDTLAAQGNATQPTYYQLVDDKPWLGRIDYRLKLFSLDGTYRYSQVQTVYLSLTDLLFRLIWCIIGHNLQIWLDIDKSGPASLQLIDLQGRIRYQGMMNTVKGKNFKTLDISNLSNGVYFLRVQSGSQVQTTKIFLNH